jgi:hypothetical protein
MSDNLDDALAFAQDAGFNERLSPFPERGAILIPERRRDEAAGIRKALQALVERYPRYLPAREYRLRHLFTESSTAKWSMSPGRTPLWRVLLP